MARRRAIRRDLYETISRAQPKTIEDLSPHWRGQGRPPVEQPSPGSRLGHRGACGSRSAWLLPCICATPSERASRDARLDDGGDPSDHGTDDRARNHVKPPPDPKPRASTQLQRIRAALAKEILAGKVDATQSATTIFIRIGNVGAVSFRRRKGQRLLRSASRRRSQRRSTVSRAPIHVDGYTDSDPIRTVAFPSNFELSAGARQVGRSDAETEAVATERLVVTGKGPGNPIAPNDTELNKSKNRRVEVSIPRAD